MTTFEVLLLIGYGSLIGFTDWDDQARRFDFTVILGCLWAAAFAWDVAGDIQARLPRAIFATVILGISAATALAVTRPQEHRSNR